MGPLIRARRLLPPAVVALAALGCGEGTEPLAGGGVRATLVSGAGSSEGDSVRVVLDGRESQVVSAPGEALFFPVAPGEHLVALDQLRTGCAVSGESARAVEVVAGDTTDVEFDVGCAAAAGSLVVRVTATGEDQDPSGYTVVVDGEIVATEVLVSAALRVASGRHDVTLRDLTPSCSIAGDSTRTVDVPANGTVGLEYAVGCTLSPPAGRGKEIVFQTDRAGNDPLGNATIQLYAVNNDGTGLHLLFEDPRGQQTNPAWSPNGERLLFSLQTEALDRLIFGVNADGGDLASFLTISGQPAWSPDMTQVAISTSEAPNHEDEFSIVLTPADAPDVDDLDLVTTGSFLTRPTWSPDGSHLAYVNIDGDGFEELEVMDLATRIPVTLPLGLSVMDDLAWSPDGTELLLSGSPQFGQSRDLYLASTDGLQLTRLTNTPADELEPTWSPDGTRIAFASNRDGNYEIYAMNADGTDPVRLTNDPAEDRGPAWRP
ncbi:MAG TPA: hypothetical protein VIR33_10135 [Thermopolyspora sp.]